MRTFFRCCFSDHDYPSSSSSQRANKVGSVSMGPVDFCDLAFELCLGQVEFFVEGNLNLNKLQIEVRPVGRKFFF